MLMVIVAMMTNENDNGATNADGQDSENGGDGGVEIPEYLGHPGCMQRHGKQRSNRLLPTICQ